MKVAKIKFGIVDVAEARGIAYRRCLKEHNMGQFKMDEEDVPSSLSSIASYLIYDQEGFENEWKIEKLIMI